jgi:hypothetical protein
MHFENRGPVNTGKTIIQSRKWPVSQTGVRGSIRFVPSCERNPQVVSSFILSV